MDKKMQEIIDICNEIPQKDCPSIYDDLLNRIVAIAEEPSEQNTDTEMWIYIHNHWQYLRQIKHSSDFVKEITKAMKRE
jgi:hypothetical protein